MGAARAARLLFVALSSIAVPFIIVMTNSTAIVVVAVLFVLFLGGKSMDSAYLAQHGYLLLRVQIHLRKPSVDQAAPHAPAFAGSACFR